MNKLNIINHIQDFMITLAQMKTNDIQMIFWKKYFKDLKGDK